MSEIYYHEISTAVDECLKCLNASDNVTGGEQRLQEERLQELEVVFRKCAKTIGAVDTDATDARYTLWKVASFRRDAQKLLKDLGHALEEFRQWAVPDLSESELLEGEQPCAEEQLEYCRKNIENRVKDFEAWVENSSKAPKG